MRMPHMLIEGNSRGEVMWPWRQSVAANIQIYVLSAANAKEAWENLEKHFEKKSLSQKIYIFFYL